MPAIAFGSAVGLFLLYISVGCRSMAIRDMDNEITDSKFRVASQGVIQVCGPELTSMITFVCNGQLRSPNEDYGGSSDQNGTKTGNQDHRGVVEKCCKNPCNVEFIFQHCGGNASENMIFQMKRKVRNDLPRYVRGKGISATEPTPPQARATPAWIEKKINEIRKVRVNDGNKRRKNRLNIKRGRKKRKNFFKYDSAFKSFGHYLLNLDHDDKFRNKIRKRKNVPDFEVGTIKPDVLGGEPVVVGSRRISKGKPQSFSPVISGNSILPRH